MEEIVGRDLVLQRSLMALSTVFSVIAVTLALIGLYALISYLASQRTREVGIRMALGATARRVLANFVGEGLALGAAGVVIGLVGAVFAARAIVVFLAGIEPFDRPTFATVGGGVLASAALASLAPALRAARVSPGEALRAE
jgi:ABC-type antimicrobial peptide transport system permease subunit